MIVNRDNLLERISAVFPFNQADHEQVSILADKSEVVFFKSGDMIYLEGAQAKFIYIIFEGEVEILKEDRQLIIKKNHLYQGDLLGEDMLTGKHERQTSTRALEDTLLIRISLPVLARFLHQNPNLKDDFQFLVNRYQILVHHRQEFNFDTEPVYYISQPHKIYMAAKACLFLMIALLGCAAIYYLSAHSLISAGTARWLGIFIAGLYLTWFLWKHYEWSNDLFIFTDRRVISREQGIFLYESRDETPLDAIISISSQANILGRQYGFGDLFIKTFTGSLCLKNVPDIYRTQKILEYLIEKNHLNQHQDDKKDFENLLRVRMGMDQAFREQDKPESDGTTEHQSDPIHSRNFVQRLMGLKHQTGGNIVYRTHWIFLFRKTIFPFLLLTSLVFLLIYLNTAMPEALRSKFLMGLFAVLLISTGLWWLYQYLDWRNDQYIITPEQLIDVYRKPLGVEDKRTAPLENIQSIRYKRQGILGLLFNYGTVYVKVGNEDFTFDNVYRPSEIQQTLFATLERADLLEKRANVAQQQRQMADWMDTYQRLSREHPHQDEGPYK
jgi:hypothetical protein